MWHSESKSVGKLVRSSIGAAYAASRRLLNAVDDVQRSTTARKRTAGQHGKTGTKDGANRKLRLDAAYIMSCRVFD